MFRHEDLEYVLRPYLEVGMFYPKSGEMENITVVNFYISERNILDDMVTFVNYMPLVNLIDVSYSNYINEDFEYLIYIELSNSDDTFDDIIRLCYELMAVSGLDEWSIKVYKKEEKTYTYEQIKSYFK